MKRRAFHMLLALGLAVSVFAGTVFTGSAQPDPMSGVVFPWVPNGAVIDDDRGFGTTGPYYGTVTIQNLEDDEIDIYYASLTDEDIDFFDTGTWETTSLDAHATVTLTASDIFNTGNDVDGSAVVVAAAFADDSGPARIAGVEKQAAPIPPGAGATTGDDHEVVSGYTGLTLDQIGDNIVLPIAQTNTNWNTLVHVTNFDPTGSTDISVTFHPAGATGWSATFTAEDVEPGETATFDLLDLAPPGEWVGSAEITATGESSIGAVAERAKNETNMLIMNVSRLAPANGDEQYAPLVFNNYNFWNTGISLANLTGSENDVVITYFDPDGNEAGEEELTLPPNGMDFIYTPAQEDGEEFIGSAIIEADGAIAGAVDEVKYFGEDPDTGHAMSYMIESDVAGIEESLVLPLVQKGSVSDEQIAHGDTTGIHLFNPTEEWVVVGISYVDQDGDEVLTDVELINAKEGLTSYTIDLAGLPEDFQGSAFIQILSGDGAIVAASNNVNYDVEFDGSASFNLVQFDQVGPEVPEAEVDAVTNGD